VGFYWMRGSALLADGGGRDCGRKLKVELHCHGRKCWLRLAQWLRRLCSGLASVLWSISRSITEGNVVIYSCCVAGSK
jgi:hypothetical protein